LQPLSAVLAQLRGILAKVAQEATMSSETLGYVMIPVVIVLLVASAAKRQSQLRNRKSDAELRREAEQERDEHQS
jgi:hypothetical protein